VGKRGASVTGNRHFDESYDVICVGGGLGGLAAALRAHELGCSVLVLERSAMVGGVCAYSGGWVWVGASHLASFDTLEETERYLDYVQGEGRPIDRDSRRAYLEAAVEATRWFAEAGVPLTIVRDAPDLYAPSPGSTSEGRLLECAVPGADLGVWRRHLRPSVHYRTGVTRDEHYHQLAGDVGARLALAERRAIDDFLTHGVGLSAGFIREALVLRDVECRIEHRVTELLTESDRVTGVVAQTPAGPIAIGARLGVLIASGSYGNAPDAAELEDVPELIEAAPPVVDGDGLSLAQSVGAATIRGADPFVVLGLRFGSDTHPGTVVPLYSQLLENLGFPHSLVVNREGRRFGDESYYGALIRGVRSFDSHHNRWANYPCFVIFDEEYRERYPFGPCEPGDDYGEAVTVAPTLHELASRLGIDAGGLVAEVERYNGFCKIGEDADFARGHLAFAQRAYGDPRYRNPNLGPVSRGPFYGAKLTCLGVGMGSMGLAIDRDARVQRRDGRPIEGLYATGNAAATRELKGYVTGLCNARNYTYAYKAANHMVTARILTA
jgi:3-oxosteroid 1-dehydrogenase